MKELWEVVTKEESRGRWKVEISKTGAEGEEGKGLKWMTLGNKSVDLEWPLSP